VSLLITREVSKNFGALAAVKNVSLTVEAGQICGLVGPNGAGKTTLFNLITGFSQVSSGEIFFHGKNITTLPTYRRVKRGLTRTFQTPQLFGEMTTLENVVVSCYGSIIGGFYPWRPLPMSAQKRAQEILEFVGLSDVAQLPAKELPYASQRKLEIARALMSDPKLVLLDEPAAGMNPTEVAHLMDLIRAIRTSHRSVLVVEHNMRLIMEVSDQVTVIDFGRIIAEGSPGEIRRHPEVISAYLGAHA
jgi:branched-chain amino acid transport system ATP-binding protein